MYECLIKKHNSDGSTSYEYWCDEGRPRCPHIPIPEGAEYFICHEGIKYDGYNELYFFKDDFEVMHSVGFSDENSWSNSNWSNDEDDRLEYMKEQYGSVVLWKREEVMNEEYPDDVVAVTKCYSTILYWYDDGLCSEKSNGAKYKPYHKNYQEYVADNSVFSKSIIYERKSKTMNEDEYLLTKLQACDVLLNEPEILQCESIDGSWFDIDWNSFHVQNIILDKESNRKLRIKPEWEHIPIEFSEVMDMLTDNKGSEVFINKEVNLAQAENPLFYLQYQYHDKYSRVVEKQITYDQWKNCKKGEENV